MDRNSIEAAVIGALRDTLQQSGEEAVIEITPETRPIGDLGGFDSLNAVEATVFLEDRLGRTLPDNVFVDEVGRRALRIHEIVDRLHELQQGKEAI